VTDGSVNAPLPKAQDLEKLTFEQAMDLLSEPGDRSQVVHAEAAAARWRHAADAGRHPVFDRCGGLSVSPDFTSIICSRCDQCAADIMLVDQEPAGTPESLGLK